MNRLILVFLICFSACKSTAYFVSPNDVHQEKVTVYLKKGDIITGLININMESNSRLHAEVGDFKPTIEIMPEGKTTWQKINILDIVGYTMGSDYFTIKSIDLLMDGTSYLLFVKRLTPENSRIQLYQLDESGKANDVGEKITRYYLSFPGYSPLETLNAKSSQLVPNFDLKMSNWVDDCPNLAKKIRKKETGYFYGLATFNAKTTPDVLLRIITEYNSCTLTASPQTN